MFDFGMRIKELRKKQNMSQAELSRRLGKSKAVVCAYENNYRKPPLEVIIDMALLFNVSLDYLVGIDKNEMLSVSGLSNSQKELIHSLITELKGPNTPYPGLSDSQQNVLNKLIVEFYKKHK